MDSASISLRILLCNLMSLEGLEFTFIAAHFSDQPEKRRTQWLKLKRAMNEFPGTKHLILLADHDSVITPGVDSEVISTTTTSPPQSEPKRKS